MPQEQPAGEPLNPYAAPSFTEDAIQAVSVTTLQEVDHLRSFVGKRSDYYLGKWGAALRQPGAACGFNWAAFLFTGIWLPYRKMYRATFIFWGIVIAESVLQEVVFLLVLGATEVPEVLDRIITLAISIYCGSSANRWYLNHATRSIAEIKAKQLDPASEQDMIVRRGGTNLWGALGLLILNIAIFMVISLILAFALYPEELFE